jgi:hypothetical protein
MLIYMQNKEIIKNFNKRKNLSFTMRINKFGHLSRAELNSIYLTKINISDLIRISNNSIKSKITNNYNMLVGNWKNNEISIKRNKRFIKSWVNINWASYGYVSPVQTQGGKYLSKIIRQK